MRTSWAMAGAELHYHFVNIALLTALVSLFVLWRYRCAVLEGMRHGEPEALPMPSVSRREPAAPSTALRELLDYEQSTGNRLALAYWLTTLSCGIPLAVGYLYLSGMAPSLAKVVSLGLGFSLVCLPMIIVSLALPPGRAMAALAQLLLLTSALVILVVMIERILAGRPINWQIFQMVPLFLQWIAIQLWMPGLFWLLTWPSCVRGVAPITFAALLVFGLAPFLGTQLTDALAATEAGTPLAFSLGQSGVFLLLALPTGWLAWRRLRLLSREYAAKRFSDAQLLARTWWLFLVVSVIAELLIVRQRPLATLLLGAALLIGFAPVNRWWLHRLRAGLPSPPPRTLLLLRVFGYTARTERLFDRIGARWRLFGPVTMIAAPDVVARTIDPGDYLQWLTGHLGELFVTSRASLNARLAAIDSRPDPDGRYRINEFCCGNNTWQATVVELMERADAVVMDLRGVTSDRLGCKFELQQLAQRMPPRRVVLLTDHATDLGVLEASLADKFAEVHILPDMRMRKIGSVFHILLQAAF